MPLFNNSGVIQQEYIPTPFYYNIWFYIFLLAVVIMFIWMIYYFIDRHFRNRIVCRIHMPNHSIQAKGFKRNKVGDTFLMEHTKILAGESIKYKFPYWIETSEIQHGIFGDYLDYYFENSRPIHYDGSTINVSVIEKEFKVILEAGLIDMIFRSSGFEKFMRMMEVIAVCLIVVVLIMVVVNMFISHPATLTYDNSTIQVIKYASHLQ